MGRWQAIVVDCERPSALARFWAAALHGYAVREYDAAEIARLAAQGFTPETDPVVMVDGPGPNLCFQQVAARDAGKGRLHLDVEAADRRAEVARLVALGASVAREADDYVVLRDPEGNRFCVVDPRPL
jgi:hypothetical protein